MAITADQPNRKIAGRLPSVARVLAAYHESVEFPAKADSFKLNLEQNLGLLRGVVVGDFKPCTRVAAAEVIFKLCATRSEHAKNLPQEKLQTARNRIADIPNLNIVALGVVADYLCDMVRQRLS